MTAMTRAELTAQINATILANGAGEITGPILNADLIDMVDSLATLNELEGKQPASDNLTLWSGLTPPGGTILGSADIGVTVEAFNANLDAWAAKTVPTGDVLGTEDIDITVQGYSANLAAWSAKTAPSGTVIGDTDAQTLTNKTFDASANALSNINTSMFAANVIDTDPTMAADSNSRLPTQHAVLTLVNTTETLNLKKDGSVALTGNMNAGGFQITNAASPSTGGALATKDYVDAFSSGTLLHDACACATTTGIVLSGEQTIDGFLTSASRILVKNLTTANGIYNTSTGSWSRATDMDVGSEATGLIPISTGLLYGNSIWAVTNTPPPVVIGSSVITLTLYLTGSVYSAGTGLQISGNQFSVTAVPIARITNLQSTLDGKAAATTTVSGGGLVTGGGALTGNQTLTVTAASTSEAQGGTATSVVITPLRGFQMNAQWMQNTFDTVSTASPSHQINGPAGFSSPFNYKVAWRFESNAEGVLNGNGSGSFGTMAILRTDPNPPAFDYGTSSNAQSALTVIDCQGNGTSYLTSTVPGTRNSLHMFTLQPRYGDGAGVLHSTTRCWTADGYGAQSGVEGNLVLRDINNNAIANVGTFLGHFPNQSGTVFWKGKTTAFRAQLSTGTSIPIYAGLVVEEALGASSNGAEWSVVTHGAASSAPYFGITGSANTTYAKGLVLAGNGSSAGPTYSFMQDPNTGMYLIGSDQLGLGTSGTQRLKITNTQIVASNVVLTSVGTATAFQVLTNRQHNWATAASFTGSPIRTAYTVSTVTVSELAQRVLGLITDLQTHGLIGP